MTDLIKAGGPGFILPTVLFVLLLFASRGLFSLHGRRSQHRKDVLELWGDARTQDDFWLEVAVRHWLGTYLPGHVIRLALAQPDKAQSLVDLSALWDLLKYDTETRTVSWKRAHHRIVTRIRTERLVMVTAYFVCALSAVGSGWLAARLGSGNLGGWAYGVLCLLLGVLALGCLWRDDMLKVAARCGARWVMQINDSSAHPHARPVQK